MSSEIAVSAVESRLHRLSAWFDPEAAGVVTILLGLFQVILSVPLAYADQNLPKLFILPLVLGILIVAGGSLTIANERNSSRLLLRGCACSNVVGLLGALLAFCLYCYSLSTVQSKELCGPSVTTLPDYNDRGSSYGCPEEYLRVHFVPDFSFNVAREREVRGPLVKLLPPRPDDGRMDGWMDDGWMEKKKSG